MAASPYVFQVRPESPPVEARTSGLREHDWTGTATEVDLAPLGLPTAAERRHEYRVIVDVDTDLGRVALPLALRVQWIGNNGAAAYRVTGTQYHLTLGFDLREREGEIRWHLHPGGRDAAGRAVVLDLLVAMSGVGVIVLRDPDHGVLARLRVSGAGLDESLLGERRFLTDILAIQAWSGRRLPLPDEIDEESARLIAELVYWIRRRKMRVRFTTPITALTTGPAEAATMLHLHEDAEYRLFGVWVPLGQLNYRVPVQILGVEPEGALWRASFRPPEGWLTATITPPQGRASIRDVKAVDAGEIPGQSPSAATDRRAEAHRAALEIIEEWDLHRPEDDEVRDEIRRRWPT